MIFKRVFSLSVVGFRCFLVPALLVLMASAASAERLRLVTEDWPALIDDAPGGPEGILWEISRDVLRSLGYEVTLEFVPWKRALRMVATGERDGIIGIGFNKSRASQYRFPEEHLLRSETVVISRKTDALEYSGPESLAGLKVGVSPGYSYSSAIRNATSFDKVAMPGIGSGLRMLVLGRIDAMLANRYVVLSEADRLGIGDQVSLSKDAISGGPIYLAFRPGISEDLLVTFSTVLKQYKRTNLISERPLDDF